MRVRILAGTEVVTTTLGFGCACLFRLPSKADRRAILEAAYELGIRHFDVAPMYGLGRAEAELAPVLKRRREDITITTKFGIDPTAMARGVSRLQGPVRAVARTLPRLGEELRALGQGPSSSWVGRLLYTSAGYSAQAAGLSLARSLRALGTDYIDVFVLHDPVGHLISHAPALVAYLNHEREIGRIRCWGVAGELKDIRPVVQKLQEAVPLLELRDDIFVRCPDVTRGTAGATITFGMLGRALPVLRKFFLQFPDERHAWNMRIGHDLGDATTLPALLLREALRRNTTGPVLFSSTRLDRVRVAVENADRANAAFAPEESKAMRELALAVSSTYPQLAVPYD